MTLEASSRKKINRNYRPLEQTCPYCGKELKRSHILWRKELIYANRTEVVSSWVYRCANEQCDDAQTSYHSMEAEQVHLKYRRYSRELIIQIGYRRFWHHQTVDELYEWLTQELGVPISQRQVSNVLCDFLALLRAGQARKVRRLLRNQATLLLSIDGMQPEKGNRCLYIVREVQCGQTLMAETLDDGSNAMLSQHFFEPLKALALELGLSWFGVVSDAQESIRLAVAKSLPGVPHQACQSHCLRAAGKLTFEADRNLKTRLKAAFRRPLYQVQKQIANLTAEDRFRSILADYADACQTLLLAGGLAPFDLGGLHVYHGLETIAHSLQRCQKKAIIRSYTVY